MDCPWLFERRKIAAKAEALTAIYDLLDEMEKEWSGERVYNVREYDSEVYITAEDDDGEGDDDKEEDDEEEDDEDPRDSDSDDADGDDDGDDGGDGIYGDGLDGLEDFEEL